MTTWLYLLPQRCEALASQHCWVFSPTLGNLEAPLAHAAHLLGRQRVNVILPVERFSWHLCAPWKARRAPTPEALLFELEEQLLQPLESLRAWRGQRDAQGRYAAWVTDREQHAALAHGLRSALPGISALYIDADLCGPQEPGAVWCANRWLIGGEGLPRLAATDAWLSALERTLTQPIPRLHAPQTGLKYMAQVLSTAPSGIDLLEGAGRPAYRPYGLALALATGCFALMCAADYRTGTALLAGNQTLAQYNEQRVAQLFPGQPLTPALLARLSQAKAGQVSSALSTLGPLLQRMDATPGLQLHAVSLAPGKQWRVALSAQRLQDVQALEQGTWRVMDVAAQGSRWRGTLTEGGK